MVKATREACEAAVILAPYIGQDMAAEACAAGSRERGPVDLR